ncbi:hypothetical protein [Aurantibacter aestuarii]|uniref:Glycosyltransferase RgtA/B/C/D-like domain-containing protein n=1 Tax=Aurantibacter aestuarii TaxID=1266046 RepID=A0A2T1N4N0_9FLAO|nr:hypothetical protein [Aurantibacter aestuarii]PSG86079.1 hypothetical protein C7H52_13095 [Aurantibacter aestuarii]
MKKTKAILLLLSIGLIFRLAVFFLGYPNPTFTADTQGYLELAQLIQEFSLNNYIGHRTLGYPLLIALAFGNIYVVIAYQFIIGLITSLLWFLTLIKLNFRVSHSFYTSLFLSTLLNVFIFETTILVECITLFFMSLLVYIVAPEGLNTNRFKLNLWLSLVCGALTLIKPFYAFLPFLFFGLYFLNHLKLNLKLLNKSVILIGAIVVYFGWSYVNKVNTGHFVSTTFYGLNTAQNCVRFAEHVPEEFSWIGEPYAHYREKSKVEGRDLAMTIWYAYEENAFNSKNLSFPDLSAELGRYAKVAIASNPKAYVNQVLFYSFKDFWSSSIYWEDSKFTSTTSEYILKRIWYVQRQFIKLFRLLFLLLTPFVVYSFFKKRRITDSIVFYSIIYAAAILQALVTYGNNARFSFPFEFLMLFSVLYVLKEHNSLSYVKSKFKRLQVK